MPYFVDVCKDVAVWIKPHGHCLIDKDDQWFHCYVVTGEVVAGRSVQCSVNIEDVLFGRAARLIKMCSCSIG